MNIIEILCKNCGKPTMNKNFCSLSCANGYLAKARGEKRRQEYDIHPLHCKCCDAPLEYDRRKQDYCGHSCAAQINNSRFPKRKLMQSKFIDGKKVVIIKPLPLCEMCGEECKTHKSKFCSERCSSLHRKQETDKKIESNEKVYFRQIRRYLIEKHGEKCMECGWDKKNPITNTVPLDMDHIDGDHENNVLTNLKLLCPNCHSLTPTYKGLNRGHGRAERRKRYHNGQSF
jgi:hypothetical protein